MPAHQARDQLGGVDRLVRDVEEPPRLHQLRVARRQRQLDSEQVRRGLARSSASSSVSRSRTRSSTASRPERNLPAAIVIIDTDENVDAFLPVLDEVVTDGLVRRDDAEVIRYAGSRDRARAR